MKRQLYWLAGIICYRAHLEEGRNACLVGTGTGHLCPFHDSVIYCGRSDILGRHQLGFFPATVQSISQTEVLARAAGDIGFADCLFKHLDCCLAVAGQRQSQTIVSCRNILAVGHNECSCLICLALGQLRQTEAQDGPCIGLAEVHCILEAALRRCHATGGQIGLTQQRTGFGIAANAGNRALGEGDCRFGITFRQRLFSLFGIFRSIFRASRFARHGCNGTAPKGTATGQHGGEHQGGSSHF